MLQSPWLWIGLCVVAALPLLVCPGVPPLVDLGGHLGRYAIQLDAGRSPDLRQWYEFHWKLVPNLGVDLLMQALAPRLGLEPALRLIVIAIPVIQVGGFLALARVVHGRMTPFALFALPLAYSYPFQFGFVNFALGVGLATWALALWIALADRGRTGVRWILFVPVCCLLWLCHLVGWALFCMFAVAAELATARARGLGWPAAGLRTVLPVSCIIAPWVVRLLFPSAGTAHEAYDDWFNIPNKLGQLLMPLRDAWLAWDVASTLLLFGLVWWGWRSQRFGRHAGLAMGVMALAAIYAVIPGTISGSSRADMRLVPTLVAMALIAIGPPTVANRKLVIGLTFAGLAFVGARLAGNGASLIMFDKEFRQDLAVLDKIPRGVTLVSLSVEPCHQTFLPWQRARRSHLGGYAIARRHDFSNDQWVRSGIQLLTVHNPAMGEFASDDSQWTHFSDCNDDRSLPRRLPLVPRASQYLWLIYDGVPYAIPGWRPVVRSPGSVVYAAS